MKKERLLTLLLLSAVSVSNSLDKDGSDEFYKNQKDKLIREYRTCTNDTSSSPDIDRILLWKKAYDQKTESKLYNKILTEYIAWSGKTTGISPCEVFKWYFKKTNKLLEQEESLVEKMIGNSETTLDSLLAYKQLENLVPSKYDFSENIRFGLNRKNFKYLFSAIFKKELIHIDNTLAARNFYLDGFPYTLAFKFDSQDLLYQYEIEGNVYTASSLNSCVHPELKRLTKTLEKKFGEAYRYDRIGYFDIKHGKLSPFAHWQEEGFRINTGIATHEGQYYAKAIVTNLSQYRGSLIAAKTGKKTDSSNSRDSDKADLNFEKDSSEQTDSSEASGNRSTDIDPE